ncbi:PLP-dependent aminotransferase family protein [Vibrio viridaestus]|uniref:PLP-dependent aminotransferase family protein n=1 Tax=Vibrio viridaestus TaxID=2487322 RepID=A0A3N9TCB8_9VIBR|nr:PLP-dependent aminotransferase family protein [Vibrio viridaestus]RQW61801.1 PLP-dependent aminotransferase family protein [Vibrio viridaestus]
MQVAHSLQSTPSSYIREILAAASSSDVISLAGGLPNKATFPMEIIELGLKEIRSNDSVFQYGNTAGYQPLLSYLARQYALPTSFKALITTGSQQGIDLVARAFINPGDNIVMEAPSYLGALQVFSLAQATIHTVEQTSSGPNIECLERCFRLHKPKLFYAVPDFHNPTGISWSLDIREKVASLCLCYNVTLIEDAPYRELTFEDNTLPMVSNYCPDNSIVLRSFSKIVSPGLRIGLATGHCALIEPMIKVKQAADLHSSLPIQQLFLSVISHPEFLPHLQRTRTLYSKKYQQMYSSLKHHLPDYCQINKTKGGMFIWITLPPCDTLALAKESLDNGVAIVPSCVFYPNNRDAQAGIRINFTNCEEHEVEIAAKRLSVVIESNFINTTV